MRRRGAALYARFGDGELMDEPTGKIEIVVELTVTEKMRAEHMLRRRGHEHLLGEPIESHEIGEVDLGDITE